MSSRSHGAGDCSPRRWWHGVALAVVVVAAPVLSRADSPRPPPPPPPPAPALEPPLEPEAESVPAPVPAPQPPPPVVAEPGVLEITLPPGFSVPGDPAATERVSVRWEGAGPPARVRLAGADQEVVVTPGVPVILAAAPPPVVVAAPVVHPVSSKPVPSWAGKVLSVPWAVATTTLTGAALAVASVLWTLPAGTKVGAKPLSLEIPQRPQRALAVVSLVVAGGLALVTLGILAVPFVLEQAGWMDPA